MTDRELLAAFVERKDQEAFRALVEKYLDVVHAAARRQVGDGPMAEDVAQAVFLILAQRAREIAGRNLAGWLVLTTRYCATDARKRERRLKSRELESVLMNAERTETIPSLAERKEIETVLDEALARLPAMDRSSLVLRFFREQTLGEVGKELGLSEEAAKKRVMRALERLRKVLGRRGTLLSAVVVAAALTRDACAGAAPAGLSAKICAGGMTKGGINAVLIAKGAGKAMAWATTKFVATGTVVAVLALMGGAGIVHLVQQAPVLELRDAAVSPRDKRIPAKDTAAIERMRAGFEATIMALNDARFVLEEQSWHPSGERGLPIVHDFIQKNGKLRYTSTSKAYHDYDPAMPELGFMIMDGQQVLSWLSTKGTAEKNQIGRAILHPIPGDEQSDFPNYERIYGFATDMNHPSHYSPLEVLRSESVEYTGEALMNGLKTQMVGATLVINRMPYKVSYGLCAERGYLPLKGEIRDGDGKWVRTFEANEFMTLPGGQWMIKKNTVVNWIENKEGIPAEMQRNEIIVQLFEPHPTGDEARLFDMDPQHLPAGTLVWEKGAKFKEYEAGKPAMRAVGTDGGVPG